MASRRVSSRTKKRPGKGEIFKKTRNRNATEAENLSQIYEDEDESKENSQNATPSNKKIKKRNFTEEASLLLQELMKKEKEEDDEITQFLKLMEKKLRKLSEMSRKKAMHQFYNDVYNVEMEDL